MDTKDNLPKNNNGNKPRMRFNYYWIYGIVFVALMGLYLMNDFSASKEIGWTEFQRLTADNAFDRIVVHNRKNLLEATVKSNFRDRIFSPREEQLSTEPKVYVRIPSSDKFSDFYDKVAAEKHISAQVTYKESDDILWNILASIGPFVIIILLWFFLMRRMAGGAGGGASLPGGPLGMGDRHPRGLGGF